MQTLADILAAGHPETALVGVPIATLRALVARVPDVARSPIAPVVGQLLPSAAA